MKLLAKPLIEKYSFSVLDIDHPERFLFSVCVEYRGENKYAITWLSSCYNKSTDKWETEPVKSFRTPAWQANHRFGLAEAKTRARELCKDLTVNKTHIKDLVDG